MCCRPVSPIALKRVKDHDYSWYFCVRWLHPGPVLLCARRDTELAACLLILFAQKNKPLVWTDQDSIP